MTVNAIVSTDIALAVAAGAVLIASGYLALRHSAWTIALLVLIWVGTQAIRDPLDASVTVADVRILALDVLSVTLIAVAIARMSSQGIRSVAGGLIVGLLILLLVHVARGIAESGVQAGFNGAREWLYFTSGLAYAATVPERWGDRGWKVLVALGVLVAGIAGAYLLADGIYAATDPIERDGELVNWRPVVAAGALLILQAAILAPALQWPTRRKAGLIALGAAIVIVLLQHRTLWLAGLTVAIPVLVWWTARQHLVKAVAVVAGGGLILLVMALGASALPGTGALPESDNELSRARGALAAETAKPYRNQNLEWIRGLRGVIGDLKRSGNPETGNGSAIGALVQSADEATGSDSTFTWRTAGWEQLITSNDSAAEIATGNPSGTGFAREVDGDATQVSAHNEFVDAYVRFGLPGVALLCWLGVLLWIRRADVAATTSLTAGAVGLLLLSQLVFSMAYQLDAVQGVILGILISGLVAARPDPDAGSPAVANRGAVA